jgi:hypothetical protein
MEGYKMNDGNRFYKTPWERDEIRQNHKHKQTCDKSRKKRKKHK